MNLEAQLSQLLRDALDPMLSQRLSQFEERLMGRLSAALQAAQAEPAPASANPPLLTVVELAKFLKLDRRTVERMVKAGDCPAPIRISPSRTRWRQSDIDAWLEERSAR